MLGSYVPDGANPWIALSVVACMFVLFIREAYPTEVVAIGGASALLLTGVLPYQRAVDRMTSATPIKNALPRP